MSNQMQPPSPDNNDSEPLSESRWERLSAAFADALELDHDQRATFLTRTLGQDQALLREAMEMLVAHDAETPLRFEQRFLTALA